MIEKFLKAKHWQLFILTFGIPMIIQLVMMGSLISKISNEAPPNLEIMLNYFKIFPFIMLLFIVVFFGWFWAVAVGLQHKIPEHLRLKIGLFKTFFLIPVVYMLFIIFFMGSIMNGMINPDSGLNPAVFGIILPIHLFSMFCIFYCLYFVAKTIKTAEMQKKVSFGDFAGEFFLIWFFLIGIWIIQPRVNKMIEE